MIEGATRTGYDPIRLPISLLSLGELGWMQVANFLVFGALEMAFAIGLARSSAGTSGPMLIGVFGGAVVAAGLFAADPGGGYPPGRPAPSGTGTLHDLATLVVFGSLVAAAAVFAHSFARAGRRAIAWYSAATAVAVAIGFAVIIAAFNGTGEVSRVGGLIQRLVVVIGWLWLTLLAVDARSQRLRGDSSAPD